MNTDIQLFKANEILQYKYIAVPKKLFVNPRYCNLSSDSKLLYGFILDRFHLSIQNNWKDENDNKEKSQELIIADKKKKARNR